MWRKKTGYRLNLTAIVHVFEVQEHRASPQFPKLSIYQQIYTSLQAINQSRSNFLLTSEANVRHIFPVLVVSYVKSTV